MYRMHLEYMVTAEGMRMNIVGYHRNHSNMYLSKHYG